MSPRFFGTLAPAAMAEVRKKWAPGASAVPQLASLADANRETFRAHLLRLDEQTRFERFGSISLGDAFLERYVQDIEFSNTVLLGVLVGKAVRASAELRSMQSGWGRQAELAIIVERGWQGRALDKILFRRAVCCAQDMGVDELYIYCNLAREHSVSFLRHLGKEMQSVPPLQLTALEFFPAGRENGDPIQGLIRLGLAGHKFSKS